MLFLNGTFWNFKELIGLLWNFMRPFFKKEVQIKMVP